MPPGPSARLLPGERLSRVPGSAPSAPPQAGLGPCGGGGGPGREQPALVGAGVRKRDQQGRKQKPSSFCRPGSRWEGKAEVLTWISTKARRSPGAGQLMQSVSDSAGKITSFGADTVVGTDAAGKGLLWVLTVNGTRATLGCAAPLAPKEMVWEGNGVQN